MMALYRVVRQNPYFKPGSWLRDSDPGFVQLTVMTNEGVSGYQGIMVPLKEVREYTVRIQRRGLDKYKGGALT